MRQYSQVVNLIEQGFTLEEIHSLTNETMINIRLIEENHRLENRMQANGFDRYLNRQRMLKDSGKALEQDATLAKIKKMLTPFVNEIIKFTVNYESRKPHIAVKVFEKVNSHQLALLTMRHVILGITNSKTELTALLLRIGASIEPLYVKPLTKAEQIRVCYKLVHLMCTSSDSCFKIVKKPTGGNLVYHVEATENFDEWEQDHLNEMAELAVMYRPMVVEPNPWTSLDRGGYYDPKMQQRFVRNAPKVSNNTHGPKRIPKVYEAVNKIQATRFSVNRFVLSVANSLTGDVECYFKEFYQELPERPIKEKLSTLNKRKTEIENILGITEEARKEHKKDFADWVRKLLATYTEGENYALKMELEGIRFKIVQYAKWRKAKTSKTSKNRVITTALEVANDYSDFDALYIPHNLDWRGRVYPMCSGLTTQGTCLQKALLKFAEGKPIGSTKALYWLVVHVANCFGKDKSSWQDRIEWTLSNEALIRRVATNPLENLEDWTHTDEPWLFLAACEQMNKFYHDGLDAVVDIAIPMDGTCNGAQHYSAMTRDTKGAYGVNVAPNGTQDLKARLTRLREGSQKPNRTLSVVGILDLQTNKDMKEVIENVSN